MARARRKRTPRTCSLSSGVEGRYPFLDPEVVQEYLWLSHSIKNSEYKRPLADFFRKHAFPNKFNWKSGFRVYTNTVHWRSLDRANRKHEKTTRKIYMSAPRQTLAFRRAGSRTSRVTVRDTGASRKTGGGPS